MFFVKDKVLFQRLLDQILTIPVVDCHEHMLGPVNRQTYKEPIAALVQGYVLSDLRSAGFRIPEKEFLMLQDHTVSTDQKWDLFNNLWSSMQHTAYAKVTKLVLKNIYGQNELNRQTLDSLTEMMSGMTEEDYIHLLEDSNIKAVLVDVLWGDTFPSYLNGSTTFPEKFYPLISLPDLHPNTISNESIQKYAAMVDMHVTSLDEYLEAIFIMLDRFKKLGAVGIKDQSAYTRLIHYDLSTKSDAEKQFNKLLADPRSSKGWPDNKPLNDYLFHEYMRFARDLSLPVQLHTGHMAGIYNRVDKTNAANLTSILELHQEVKFDLFHGNWPYLGDILFLGKNYPNVSLDLCWLHIIDPIYAIELMVRSVLTLPHSKIHGFGGDYGDIPEFALAHLEIAQVNIAASLTQLIEAEWVEEEDAIQLAKDWLFNNPNNFFKLGLEPI